MVSKLAILSDSYFCEQHILPECFSCCSIYQSPLKGFAEMPTPEPILQNLDSMTLGNGRGPEDSYS